MLSEAYRALSGIKFSAIAADLPRKAPVVAPAPLPVATWSGCYLTGGIGYGMWNQDNQSFTAPGVIADLEHTDGGRGWLGRVGGGCDYQFFQKWVVGVLADYDFSSLKGDMTLPGLGLTGEEKSNSAWAVGGRLGYLPWDTLLTFVSGGYTQANFEAFNFFAPTTGAATGASLAERKYTGWFLGGGYEYRFDWLPGLYWKIEYRFSSFNKKDNPILGGVGTEFVHSEKFIQTVTSSLVALQLVALICRLNRLFEKRASALPGPLFFVLPNCRMPIGPRIPQALNPRSNLPLLPTYTRHK